MIVIDKPILEILTYSVVRPFVIRAHKVLSRELAVILVSQFETAVSAHIMERVDFLILPPHNNYWIVSNLTCHVVANIGDLQIMTREDPLLMENVFKISSEDAWI